jgi:chemotaxis protein CheD
MVYEPSILRTVLGSCVGVTFWAPRLGIAALCHPMLPRFDGRKGISISLKECRRYVDFAIREIARTLEAKGVGRGEPQVKLFGGADVLAVMNPGIRPTVGKLNCESALQVLEEEGFHVSASRLGGPHGCHLSFHTDTGEVRIKRLDSMSAAEGSERQQMRGVVRPLAPERP